MVISINANLQYDHERVHDRTDIILHAPLLAVGFQSVKGKVALVCGCLHGLAGDHETDFLLYAARSSPASAHLEEQKPLLLSRMMSLDERHIHGMCV